jgi:acetyl-CoA acyltransferase
MASLPSAHFEPDLAPDITAGNSSQMNDGAAAMLIASRETAEKLGLRPRAAFRHFAVGADDAVWVLTAPNPVTRKFFAKSGLSASDFDAIEINEAFASITMAWAREFQPDAKILNPRGGAIALGHPLGASGVRLMTTMLHYLEDTGGRLGLQSMCEGGGQSNVTVIERL